MEVVGTMAMVSALAVAPEIAAFDIAVMTAATAALIAVLMTGRRTIRTESATPLVACADYPGWLGASP